MIAVKCPRCGSENIRKNGTAPAGRQKIHCRNCRFYSILDIRLC
ncbi:MAG: IS1 family transposase [Desulfococcaceae bacterium]